MIQLITKRPRLMPLCLLFALGCAGESSQGFEKNDIPASSGTDAPPVMPSALPNESISGRVRNASSAASAADVRSGDCQAQGIGDEEAFARRVCDVSRDLGLRATLVHSYGAGGVDVFISAADAQRLASNRAELQRSTTALTEWAKRNYTAFNAVTVTIVGDSKIARGSKLGVRPTTVEVFGN
jgi:hypothetical protein